MGRDHSLRDVRTMTQRDKEFQLYVSDKRASLLHTATVLASGDRHLAADLVQTALTRLYLAWPRARRMNIDAYVRRIIVNALIDEKRLAVTRREMSTALPPERPALDRTFDTGADPALLQALAALPSGMRAAVVLRHVEGLTVAETAHALGCTEGTVKSQTARGLDRLRELLTTPLTEHRT